MKLGPKLSGIPDLWNIANEIADIDIELERVQNMLQILEETLESEVSFLKESSNGYVQYFVSRYDLCRTQLEVSAMWLSETREVIKHLPPAIRSHYKTTEAKA